MKLLFLFIMLASSGICPGQETPLTKEEKAALDSMLASDVFFNMMKDARKAFSYVQVSAGMGNSYFSVRNKQLNTIQLSNKAVFIPSASYVHKSGLAISATGFLFSHQGKSDFYQYSLSPSYSYLTGKKINASVSYTHFFHRKGFENAASPVQDEIYASAYWKKTWIQPGLASGYAAGKYTEYTRIDTIILGTRRVFTDTARISLSDFSITGFFQHSFEWYELFSENDGIHIVPQLLVNASMSKFSETHQNPFITRLQNRNYKRFRNAGRFSDQSSLSLQSIGFNCNINYGIGNVGIQPQLYLDYYLPSTDSKRLTVIYSVTMSYLFD